MVAGGQNIAYYHNEANRNGNVITISASGAYSGFINYFDNPIFASDCNTLRSKQEEKIPTKLLFHLLKSIQQEIYGLQRGQAQPHVYGEDIANIKIPLPSKDIQQKIVEEIQHIEEECFFNQSKIDRLNNNIDNVLNNINGEFISLEQIAPYVVDSIKLEDININTYITTDNMLQNKLGIVPFSGEPNITSITKYQQEDILISNIRPYLKKIWFSDISGGCSKDVLVFRSLNVSDYLPKYIFYLLRRDSFFDYIMTEKKGVKMPRGNKDQILKYRLPIIAPNDQRKVISEIEKLEQQIDIAQESIHKSTYQKAAILKKYL